MPRVTYDAPQQISPGLALTDLATGLLTGYAGQQAQNDREDRAQQQAAMGNPYQRIRRNITWNALPPEIRGSRNAAMYQDMVMNGADPTAILRAHKELDADPVYGDEATRKARQADLDAAMKGGLLEPNDTAGQEGVRRGELTLGQLLKNRETAKLTKQEKDAAAATKKAEKDETAAENKKRAGQLSKGLGLDRPGDPVPVVIPTGGAGAVATQVPTRPGMEFDNPADVEAYARIKDSQQVHKDLQNERKTDNERADRKLEIQRVIADAKRNGVTLTEDEMDLAAHHLDIVNDPKAPDTAKNRSKVWLRAHKMLGEGDMTYKPTAEQTAAHTDAQKALDRLVATEKSFNGATGPDAIRAYAQQNGIKLSVNAKGRPMLTPESEAAARKHLNDAIQAAQKAVDDTRAGMSPKTAAPAKPEDQVSQMTREQKKALLQSR